jgi:hypothetical protein
MPGSLVIGVDPGLTTGIFAVVYRDERLNGQPNATQVHGSEGVVPFVQGLIGRRPPCVVVLAVEQFVVGGRASRPSSAHAGRVTRALIGELSDLAYMLSSNEHDCSLFTRTAALVKPWATDRRLAAAGLLEGTKGMGHARDAARHALYAAVHMGLTGDPLSTKAVAR